MTKPILEIQNISKKFRIGGADGGYKTLRDSLFSKKGKKVYKSEFWALEDVSFDVYPGDTVGIIGKNGAGKSTLLKILSRITPPTKGRIICRGRIASLLEVGTGFHGELSGRENIYLNGSILGLKRAEINRKFDEIVDFSGVEKFLDTQLKHYSSGMQLRLAFAVAAHLEPEILIIDEVLAVGDADFQKKCIGKMESISKSEGRTILFVSHNMSAIQSLCSKGILLEDGKTKGVFDIAQAVSQYLYGEEGNSTAFFSPDKLNKNNSVFIIEAYIQNSKNLTTDRFAVYDDICVNIKWANQKGVPVNPNFILMNKFNVNVMLAIDTEVDRDGSLKSEKGTYISKITIPKNFLNAGEYFLHIALDSASPRTCHEVHYNALYFSVWDPMDENSVARGLFTSSYEECMLLPLLPSSFTKISEIIN